MSWNDILEGARSLVPESFRPLVSVVVSHELRAGYTQTAMIQQAIGAPVYFALYEDLAGNWQPCLLPSGCLYEVRTQAGIHGTSDLNNALAFAATVQPGQAQPIPVVRREVSL